MAAILSWFNVLSSSPLKMTQIKLPYHLPVPDELILMHFMWQLSW